MESPELNVTVFNIYMYFFFKENRTDLLLFLNYAIKSDTVTRQIERQLSL